MQNPDAVRILIAAASCFGVLAFLTIVCSAVVAIIRHKDDPPDLDMEW